MIRRLRWQFIGSASIALLVVLVTIIGIINSAIHERAYNRIYTTLDYIVVHDGYLPKVKEQDEDNAYFTPETSYETRYFTMVFNKDGSLAKASMDKVAAITKEDAIALTKKVDDDRGKIKYADLIYFYRVVTKKDGSRMIVFIDGTNQASFASSMFSMSLWLGFLSFAGFFTLVCLLSGKAIKPIIRSQQQQKQFITNAGHELKTPLAVISANTEVMEMMNGKNEWTQSTMKQVKRLSGLVAELVTIARLDEREDIVLEQFDYSETLKSVAKDFQPVAAGENLTLKTDIEDLVFVKADKKRLHELANILVDNAIKYCDEKGTVYITLSKGRRVRLTVSNDYRNGANVDYSRFFERFYRADSSHTRISKGGYGIGLSMAESIVAACKGKISVSWKDNVITFEVLL